MSIFYCPRCEEYHDSDYIDIAEVVIDSQPELICEESLTEGESNG